MKFNYVSYLFVKTLNNEVCGVMKKKNPQMDFIYLAEAPLLSLEDNVVNLKKKKSNCY